MIYVYLTHPETSQREYVSLAELTIIDYDPDGNGCYVARCPECLGDGECEYPNGQIAYSGSPVYQEQTCRFCNGDGDCNIEPEGEAHWLPSELDQVLLFHNKGFRKKMIHEQFIKEYQKVINGINELKLAVGLGEIKNGTKRH